MEPSELKKNAWIMTRLIACALNEQPFCPVDDIDMDGLYHVAGLHSLTAMTAYALQTARISCSELFQSSFYQAVRQSLMMENEAKKVFDALEAHGIRYAPLKGSVINRLYPKPCLREMGDRDILFDAERAADVKRIMLSLNYEVKSYLKRHHDVYRKSRNCVFEMHRTLFDQDDNSRFAAYYSDVFSRMLLQEGSSYRYDFSEEDRYVYHISHAKLHYDSAGTGLRTLLDNYLLRKAASERFDRDYVAAQLHQLGAEDFEKMLTSASDRFFAFDGSQASDTDDAFILFGAQGTMDHLRENMVASWLDDPKHTKAGYIGQRFAGSRASLVKAHPLAQKHKALQPVLVGCRFFKKLVKKPKAVFREVRYLITYHKD